MMQAHGGKIQLEGACFKLRGVRGSKSRLITKDTTKKYH